MATQANLDETNVTDDTSEQNFPITTNRDPSCNKQLIAKFAGLKTVIRADLWINLFEVVTRSKPDSERIFTMMAYLTDDALNWFASDIAPYLDQIDWPTVREHFIARFGPAIANPIVESQHRRLKATETVQIYHEDKMRILRRSTIAEQDIVAQLTEGMPPNYRGFLLCANPQTSVAWLAIALQLEATMRYKQPSDRNLPKQTNYRAKNTKFNATQTAFVSADKRNNQFKDKPPNTPCRFCTQAGETAYHWHRECPRRRQRPEVSNNSHSNEPNTSLLADQAVALTNDHPGNVLGGHH